ncbi:uncharacterized protein [Rutidosis leptorrhynchoides]|uniref:uncharacterized protein n=1 Tax=Rutidosis leptorrhynchoides TaxID=125765 RepID=UPI003A999E16
MWDWFTPIPSRAAQHLEEVSNKVGGVRMNTDCSDSWVWDGSSNGKFTSKKLNGLIDEKTIYAGANAKETLRNYLVPKKVEVFIWKARRKRLPVRMELDKRGIDLHSIRCPLCDDDIESVDHCLISCKKVIDVWSNVFKWWELGTFSFANLEEQLLGKHNQGTDEDILQAVIWSCCYLVWKNRNQMVFKNKCWNTPMALCEIQVKTFEWVAKRHKRKHIEWLSWFNNPSIFLH